MRKRPVAVLYANLKGNVGDFAILHAMLQDLAGRYPAHPLHVYAHRHLEVDQPRLDAFLAAGVPAHDMAGTVFSRRLPDRLRRHSRGRLWPAIRRAYAAWLHTQARTDVARFADYEALYVAGGDQWGGFKGISMLEAIAALRRHTDRIYVHPFSINPRTFKVSPKPVLADRLGRLRRPLVVRDSISKSVADEIGLEAVLGGDCVFSLQDLGRAVPARTDRDPDRILICLTGSSEPKLREALEPMLAALVPAVPNLALLTTCEPEDGPLFAQLSARFGIPWLAPLTWQDTVAEIAAASLLVTNRLHGLILGSFTETPMLPVADRKKSEAFARDAGVPHAAPSIADVTADLIARTIADRDAVLARTAAYREACRTLQTRPLDG